MPRKINLAVPYVKKHSKFAKEHYIEGIPGKVKSRYLAHRSYFRSYAKKRYDSALAKGLCPHCLKMQVIPGKTYCEGCLQVHRDNAAIYSLIKAYKIHWQGVLWRRKVKREGLCVRCGQTYPEKGKSECSSCLKKRKVDYYNKKANRKKGICIRCGVSPVAPKKPGRRTLKTCERCFVLWDHIKKKHIINKSQKEIAEEVKKYLKENPLY